MLERQKAFIASYKQTNAEKKVNKAVGVLASEGFGYSVTSGIVGNYNNLPKKRKKRLIKAADTMGKFQAGYYPVGNKKNNSTTPKSIKSAHFEPLNMANREDVQQKSIIQGKSSMPLRAAQNFIQRVCFSPRLQAHPNKRVLNLTPEESQSWTNLTESLWRQDRELKDWDEALINNYDQISDMALSQLLGAGEYFAVIRNYINDTEHQSNVSIQMFHPLQVQSPRLAFGSSLYNIRYSLNNCLVEVSSSEYYDKLPKGNYIEKGIEYNKKHQEIAIFLAPVNFGEPYIKIPFKNSNGFTQVLHGFIQTEPGQKRGLPDSAYAWHEFMNIRDLKKFEMDSAKLNSTVSGTVTADSNAQPNGQQGGMDEIGKQAGWGDVEQYNGTIPEYSDPGYSVREVSGGGYIVQNFTPGYKYTEHNTSRPNLNIPIFIEKNLEYTHPGTYGISTTLVNQKFEGSYNASKGKIDISWKAGIEYYLKQFASDWHTPLYEVWLNGKIATGEITAPGWDEPRKRKAWSSKSIITPAKPSLNPYQEAKAGELRVSYGASNREYEAQQQTGTSFDENIDRIKQENVKLKEAFPVSEEGVI